MFEAIENAIAALRNRLKLETEKRPHEENIDTWVGSTGGALQPRYLKQSLVAYTTTVDQLDKAAFLKLLKKDCEEWDRELKMEVKRAHAVR